MQKKRIQKKGIILNKKTLNTPFGGKMASYIITPTSVIEKKGNCKVRSNRNREKAQETISKRGYLVNKSKTAKRLWLLFLMKEVKNLYFLTITFPNGFTDNEVFYVMNKFYTNMKKQGYFKTYLSVSERQKNGTLHFHIFISQYTPVDRIRSAMTSAIKNGIKKGKISRIARELNQYQGFYFSRNKKGKVANLKKMKGNRRKKIMSYVTKYVSKSNQESETKPIYHRRVSLSHNLSSIPLKIEVREDQIDQIFKYIIEPARKANILHEEEYFTVYPILNIPPKACSVLWNYIESCGIMYKLHKEICI